MISQLFYQDRNEMCVDQIFEDPLKVSTDIFHSEESEISVCPQIFLIKLCKEQIIWAIYAIHVEPIH